MGMWLGRNKGILLSLLAVVLALQLGGWYGSYKYSMGIKYGEERLRMQMHTVLLERNSELAELSSKYAESQRAKEAEAEVRYVEVQKIVERPVYHNICIDDDGLQLINAAINEN